METLVGNRSFSLIIILIICAGIGNVYAQTGPGGVGHRDSADMLVLWLKADEGITMDASDYVSLWADLSGYGNNATSSGNDRPQYVDSAINNLPGVLFLNDQMVIQGDNSLQPGQITIFAVVERDVMTGWGDIISRPYYNYNSWASPYTSYTLNSCSSHFMASKNQPFSQCAVDGDQVANWNPPHDLVDNDVPYIHAMDFDGNGMGSYLNNALIPGYSAYIPHAGTLDYNGTLADVSLGTRSSYLVSNPHDDHFLKGKISEIIIYDTSVNEAAHVIVANALSAKYDIEIGWDVYSEQAGFTHDIIGIGKDNDEQHLSAEGGNLIIRADTFPDNTSYVFAGNNRDSLSMTSQTIPEEYNCRMNRIWHIASNGTKPDTLTLVFLTDYTPGSNHDEYGLLFSNNNDMTACYEKMKAAWIDQSEQKIVFKIIADSLTTGYYTWGSLVNHWLGDTDQNWNNAFNWEKVEVPGIADDVTIPRDTISGSYPVINGGIEANVKTLKLETGTSLSIQGSSTLNIGAD